MGTALGRRERHPAVVALAPVVVQRAGNPVAIGIVDTVQQGISQRAVARGTASQIDDVGPPRHQLDRKPVAVAIAPDPARGRVTDRDPPARGRIPGEVLAGRLGYRLRRALSGSVTGSTSTGSSTSVVDGPVGRLIPVARRVRSTSHRSRNPRPRPCRTARRWPRRSRTTPPRCRPQCCRSPTRRPGPSPRPCPAISGSRCRPFPPQARRRRTESRMPEAAAEPVPAVSLAGRCPSPPARTCPGGWKRLPPRCNGCRSRLPVTRLL